MLVCGQQHETPSRSDRPPYRYIAPPIGGRVSYFFVEVFTIDDPELSRRRGHHGVDADGMSRVALEVAGPRRASCSATDRGLGTARRPRDRVVAEILGDFCSIARREGPRRRRGHF